eukprot:11185401-Lingulodinium_polyedra.AAC.1
MQNLATAILRTFMQLTVNLSRLRVHHELDQFIWGIMLDKPVDEYILCFACITISSGKFA